VNGYQIKARRRAREIVDDMRWRGMTVPPLYTRMAREFQELVRSGDYAAWVAQPEQSSARHVISGGQLASAGRAAPRRHPSPGPVLRPMSPAVGPA
jgi:hypothetical protein